MSFARLHNVLRTASFKLAAVYAALFIISALVLGAVVVWVVASTVERYRIQRVEAEVAFLLLEYDSEGLAELVDEVSERIESGSGGGLYYGVIGPSGERLVGNLMLAPETPIGWQDIGLPGTAPANGSQQRVLVVDVGNSARLAVGDNFRMVDEITRALVRAFVWVLAGFLVVGLVGGWLVSASFLKRIEEITKTADGIVGGDMERRIPIRGTNDDFDRLAATLNRMLDRISSLLENLRQVSNDIAHNLKTPLTRLRNRLIAAKSNGHDQSAAMSAAIDDTEEILETFSALLRIAQIESGIRRSGFRELDLSSLFEMVADDFRPVAEANKKTLTANVEPGIMASGDKELLVQMLANLLENAIRHTPAGTGIILSLAKTNDGFTASVADNGPGVPFNERERIFRRFYRLEPSRTTQGSGLGLSLVAAIADLHGLNLVVKDNGPGLSVSLGISRLPDQRDGGK
jgi:signal transduction histidine kinase